MKDLISLHDIGIKYGTDKAVPHNYCHVYEKFMRPFRFLPIRLLEIGVYGGASLKMWEEFFPNATIYGIDIEDKSKYSTDRIIIYCGDQSDRNFMNLLPDNFDVIIDDGGHTMEQQMISFGCLFKKLKSGGIYILEDLVTSLWTLYGGNKDNKDTTLSALHNLKESHSINSKYLLQEEKIYIENMVNEVNIFGHYGDESVSTKAITSIITKK